MRGFSFPRRNRVGGKELKRPYIIRQSPMFSVPRISSPYLGSEITLCPTQYQIFSVNGYI